MPARSPIGPSIPHSESVPPISGRPIFDPSAVYLLLLQLIPLESQCLLRPWYQVSIRELLIFIELQMSMGVHPLPAIENH